MSALRMMAGPAALALSLGLWLTVPAVAAEGAAPKADVVGEASSPSPKSPIRVKVVDYQKAEEGPGTLKLSGTAIAGSDVFIYFDDKPFAQVVAAEGDGAWAVEDKIEIDEAVHSVRVEQFDETTNMLSGRAQFSISLTPPTAEDMPKSGATR
jgi:hypothetical protein